MNQSDIDDMVEDMEARLEDLEMLFVQAKKNQDALVEALSFYANPETYFGIAIFPDQPCGDFWVDFSEVPWQGTILAKPGKRAREALAAHQQK